MRATQPRVSTKRETSPSTLRDPIKGALFSERTRFIQEQLGSHRTMKDFPQHLQSLATIKRSQIYLQIPPEHKRFLIDAAQSHMEDSNIKQLAQTATSLGTLGILSPDYLTRWQERWVRHSGFVNSEDLVSSFYALALRGVHPRPDLMDKWEQQINLKLRTRTLSSSQLGILLFSYALLEMHPAPVWSESLAKLKAGNGKYSLSTLHQLKVAGSYFKHQFNLELPENILEKLNASMEAFKAQAPCESLLQREVFNDLERIYPGRVEWETWIPPVATFVDVTIPDRRIVIQINGPQHYDKADDGTAVLRSKDRLKNAILRAENFQVRTLTYWQWEEIKGWKTEKRQKHLIDWIEGPES